MEVYCYRTGRDKAGRTKQDGNEFSKNTGQSRLTWPPSRDWHRKPEGFDDSDIVIAGSKFCHLCPTHMSIIKLIRDEKLLLFTGSGRTDSQSAMALRGLVFFVVRLDSK